VIVLAASAAFADDKQDAAALFEQGRELVRADKFAEACDLFERSYRFDPAPGTELNLGDCHEHLGHVAEALRHFDHAAAQFELAHDERAKYARDRRAALEPRLGPRPV